MKRLYRLYQPAYLVPFLFVLYLVSTYALPSPFFAILLGLAVVVAANAWEVRCGVLTATAAFPFLLLGLWRLSQTSLAGGPPELQAYIIPWIARAYLVGWLAMLVAGVFVGNLARQTRRLGRLNRELKQAQQRLTALHQIALSLSTTLDVGRLLETILDQLGTLWGYDHGSILLHDETSDELVTAAARGYDVNVGHRFPTSTGVCGAVFRSGTPAFVPDVTVDTRYVPGLPGAQSELAVPLVWEGRVLGVLNVESKSPAAYGPEDLDLLTTVAEQAAAAIGNARLHQRTRDLAIQDPHTGLFNYRHFQEQLAATVRDSQLAGA
ncbi:MAG TPA: GAF domain-containing protein, partial [Symbiobacteriaceae bacterium]|nr:GAF domain-containing protein [Symbiobacteriaceae bacterium]